MKLLRKIKIMFKMSRVFESIVNNLTNIENHFDLNEEYNKALALGKYELFVQRNREMLEILGYDNEIEQHLSTLVNLTIVGERIMYNPYYEMTGKEMLDIYNMKINLLKDSILTNTVIEKNLDKMEANKYIKHLTGEK